MRFRIRVARVQSVERVVNAADEQAAIAKIESELQKPYGLLGAWTTVEGIPGRALRALRLAVPLKHFPRFLRSIERDPAFARTLLRQGIALGSEMARRRPGRAGRTDS
jgi:hypothetical protein